MPGASKLYQWTAPPAARRRLELQVLLLQSAIAGFYCVLVLTGVVPVVGDVWKWAVGWIASYHLFHAWYVLDRRMRGRPLGLVEAATPLLDITCITAGWIAIGDPESALWGIFIYAVVSYSRRIYGLGYAVLALFVAGNVVAGRVLIAAHGGPPAFDSDLAISLVLLGAVALVSSAIGNAWRNAEGAARRLAETDPLTAIANRRVFLERVERCSADPRCQFAILMLDLDDFKRLNDEYGHLHGDDVLTRVAKVLSLNLRADDMVARYGGEEFVIAMPEASVDEAMAVADRLRLAVAGATPTTVSIGCAVREPGEEAESVIRRADAMLLSAKRNGKNRTRVSEPLKRSA